MAKAAVKYACSECGYSTGKWLGRCPSCNGWSTLVEERAAPVSPTAGVGSARPLLRLVEVEATEDLTMSWCLGCHRDPAPHVRPPTRVTDMEYAATESERRALAASLHVRALTHCSTCHR